MERRNITQPTDWWAAFAATAEQSGKNLSEWMGDAAKAKLPKEARKKLTQRTTPGRPSNDPG